MAEESHNDLFKLQSYNCYVTWARYDKNNVPEDAITLGVNPTDGSKVFIGRVERNGHIIPGTIRSNGECRFRFEGEWHTERDRIEILKDNFGMADEAMLWCGDSGKKDDFVMLPLLSEIGGVQPTVDEDGEHTGWYLLARPKGTLDIRPIPVSRDDRHFDEGYIAYRGTEKDFEVLNCEYTRHVAICPSKPME